MDTTFTFNIKAVSDMKDVVSNIENIQGALNKLKLPDNMKASFDKTFKSLLREVENYQAILNKPTKTKGDVTGLEKSGAKIITLYDQIAQKIKSIDDSTLKKAFKDLGAEEVKSLKQEISSLQTDLANLTKSSDFAKGLKSSFEDLKSKIKSADSDVSKLVNKLGSSTFGKTFLNNIDTGRLDLAAKNIEKIKSEIEKLKGVEGYDALKQWITDLENGFNELSKNDFIQNLTEKLKTLKTNLSGSEAKILDAFVKGFKDGTLAIDELGRVIVKQHDNTKKLTAAQAEYNREVDTLKSRIQYFFGLNNAINLIKRTMRSAIQTIKDLDKAMTETAVVTDFTVSDMWAQLPEYTKRANELGVSTQAAYEAATLYYQQGLKTNQVVALSNETLKMARIAGLDAADATDRMTNALRGFNMELNETNAERVNDVYSKLAAISASNVDEISTAMTKVASLAHNAGMEFETTAAFLAQIIETTRESAETAGTALKTVVARFSEVKKLVSKDQLKGQDEEGQIIDVNKVSAALRTAGIDLNKYFTGEVGLDDIFMELASKWNSLTTLQQRYIATQAAGSRQQSRFIALMSDYARTQELVGEAYNANGAAAKQFAKTQDSLESKLARLKNAWNEFAMGILNSDVLKIGVDLLTNLLNIVNGLTTGFGLLSGKAGGFISSIAKIAVLLGGLKLGKGLLAGGSASVLKFISGGEKGAAFGTAFKQSMASGGLLGGTVKGIGSGIKGLGGGITGLFTKQGFSAGAAAAKAATGAAGLGSLGVGLAAIAVVVGLAFTAYKLWEKFSPAGKVKRAQKALEKQKKELEEAESNRDKIKNVQETYKEKTDQVNNATTIQDRQKAIEERNEMILKALEEDPTLAQYVITERIDDQLVLTIDEDSLANAIEAAERVARQERYDTAAAELNATIAQLNQARSTSGTVIGQANYAATHFDWENTTLLEGAKRVLGYIYRPWSLNMGKDIYTALVRNNPTAAAKLDIFGSYGEATVDEVRAYLEAHGDTLTKEQQQALWQYIGLQEKYINLMDAQAQNMFYQRYAAEGITSPEAYDLIPLLTKFYKESGENGYEWPANTETILKAVNDDQFASIIDAVSGKGAILDQSLLNFNIEDPHFTLSGGLDRGTDDKLLELLGIDEATLQRWNTMWGNDLTRGFIRNLARQQQAIQIQNAKNLGKNLGRMDANLPRGTDFSQKSPKEIQDLLNLTNVAIEKLSPDQYGDFANFWFNNPDTIEEALKLFDSINLDNPISAYSRLIKIQEKGTETQQEYAAAILNSHKELFSSGGLVKAFISSSSYEDLSDSLSDFIKENGEITADNIIELAKSNEDLNALLRTNIVSAEELARVFTLYEKGTLGFNAITDALIEAAGAGDTFYNTLDRIDKWIKDFNDGITSSTKGIEHITEVLENLAEHAEIGDITNTEFREGFYHLFGEDVYNDIYNSYTDPQERVRQFQQYISNAQGYYEDYGLDLYRAIWEKGGLHGFTSSDNGGNNFGWDLSDYANQDEAIDAFVEATQKATGITLDREAARATIAAFGSFAGIQDQWDELGYKGALQTFAQDTAGQEAVTWQTLQGFGSQYGVDADQVWEDLQKYYPEGEVPLKVKWVNDDGTELTDDDLLKAFEDKGISLKGYEVKIGGETRIDIDAASEGLKKYGLSQAQIDTILNNSGMLLAKQFFHPSFFGIERGSIAYGLGNNVEAATEDANRRAASVDNQYKNLSTEDFINLFNGSLTPIMDWQKGVYELVDSARFTADMDAAVADASKSAAEAAQAATDARAAAEKAEQTATNFFERIRAEGLAADADVAEANAAEVAQREGRTLYQRAIESLETIPDLLKSGEIVQAEQALNDAGTALGFLKDLEKSYPNNEILTNLITELERRHQESNEQYQQAETEQRQQQLISKWFGPLENYSEEQQQAILRQTDYVLSAYGQIEDYTEEQQQEIFTKAAIDDLYKQFLMQERGLTEKQASEHLGKTSISDMYYDLFDADGDNEWAREAARILGVDSLLGKNGEWAYYPTEGWGTKERGAIPLEESIYRAQDAEDSGNKELADQFWAQAINAINSLDDLGKVAELYGGYVDLAAKMEESGVDVGLQAWAWRKAYIRAEDENDKEIYASNANLAASRAFDNIFTEALKVLYEDIDDDMARNLVQELSTDDKRRIIDSAYQRDSSELEGTYLGEKRFSTFTLDWFQWASEKQRAPSTQEVEVDVDEKDIQNQVQTTLDQGYTLNITSLEITLPGGGILTPKTSGATGGIVGSYAGGRHRKLKPGMALTGEEAPEIVWNKEKGYAYITGAHGPQFQNLKPGDQVFNGEDTKKILGNSETKTLFGSYWPGADGSSSFDPFGAIVNKTKEVLEGFFPEGNKKANGGGGGGGSKSSDEWKNELDWLYDLMEDIAEEEHKQTLIQAEFELAEKDLSKTGRDLYDLTKAELDTLQTQLSAQQFAFEKRLQQMNELQQKVEAEGFQEYLRWNSEDNTLEIDWDKINEIKDKDTYDKLSELVSDMEEVQNQMDEAQEATLDIKKQIQELQTRFLQAYLDFQNKVMDALVAQYQQNIDNFQTLNDTINEANQSILDSIQKEIDLQRQIRDNTKTETEIADLEAKIAFLLRDSTGSNQQELQELQKQLKEAREDYSDTLVDQAIDRLSQNNNDAQEQREKQLELLQAQLEYWKETGALWGEVAELIAEGFDSNGSIIEDSKLWTILADADSWKGLSLAQKANWANELINETKQVWAYLIQLNEGETLNAENIKNAINGQGKVLADAITTETSVVRAQLNELIKQLGGTPIDSIPGDGGYASGGLATKTGFAMLHGSTNEPEYVLNARQTDAFLRLADVLPSIFSGNGYGTSNFGGNVYVELNMSVGEIGSDYDVDRLVARVKDDIYDASSYRNVNAVSFLR